MANLNDLDRTQISLRIKAARELRGLTQTDLGDLFDAQRLNKSDPGRLERKDPNVPFLRSHLDALCRMLRVPEEWFTAESVDDIVGYRGIPQSVLAQQAAELAEINKITDEMRETVQQLALDSETRDLEVHRRLDEIASAIPESQNRGGQQP